MSGNEKFHNIRKLQTADKAHIKFGRPRHWRDKSHACGAITFGIKGVCLAEIFFYFSNIC